MTRILLLVILTAAALPSYAESDLFIGGGLDYGTESTQTAGNGKANFTVGGFRLDGGYRTTSGIQFSGDVGKFRGMNNLESSTYMETSETTFMTAKLGFATEKLTMGLGYRRMSTKTTSISTVPANRLESKFLGFLPMAYVGAHFATGKRLRTVVEAEYTTGDLPSTTDGVADAKTGLLLLSLRLQVEF